MEQDRRGFLATLGAATIGLATGRSSLAEFRSRGPSGAKLSRIGIQLYTLRKQAAADLPGTVAQIAKIGYKEVELAGFYDRTATDFRELLNKNGLTAPSSHISLTAIQTAPEKTFGDAKTMGNEWIVVPSPPPGKYDTVDDWKHLAEQFNTAATQVKAAGFRFAFHNHNDVFKKVGDVLPIDLLMKETDPALVSYEMDVYWVTNGGGNPVELLTRYPDRFKLLHLKDSMGPPDHKMVDVGAGTIDFKAVLARAKAAEHYFVEHDQPPNGVADAAASYSYLAKLEY
jgi:sugar phosphate isomerase/epimerase